MGVRSLFGLVLFLADIGHVHECAEVVVELAVADVDRGGGEVVGGVGGDDVGGVGGVDGELAEDCLFELVVVLLYEEVEVAVGNHCRGVVGERILYFNVLDYFGELLEVSLL